MAGLDAYIKSPLGLSVVSVNNLIYFKNFSITTDDPKTT